MIDVEQDILLLGDLNSWLLHAASRIIFVYKTNDQPYLTWDKLWIMGTSITEHPVASENLGRF